MKNILKLALLALLVSLVPGLAFAQQNTIVQTTLSAAVSAPSVPGAPPVPANLVQIASATGIVANGLNGTSTINSQNAWVLYIDREEMLVTGVNGTTLQVVRGYNSTAATAHVSGQMVLYGKANWFYQTDPGVRAGESTGISNAGCTAASVYVTPWINVQSGYQWICSTITATWVPGFGNPGQKMNTTLVADAASAVTPSGPQFELGGGTNAVTGFNIPVGCNATAVGGCQFLVFPTTAWTWTTGGNINVAGTAVAFHAIWFNWDATTSKWEPLQGK